MPESPSSDDWGTASSAYAARVEYVTRPSAEALISWVYETLPLRLLRKGPGQPNDFWVV